MSQDNLEQDRYAEILRLNGIQDKISRVDIVRPNLSGNQFASTCFNVTVHFEEGTEQGKNLAPLELFVKKAMKDGEWATFLLDLKAFEKEAMFFNNILKEMEDFCKRKLGSDDFFHGMLPKCYYADESFVVLENLATKGYVMKDKKDCHDFVKTRLVMERLAKLHAVSYCFVQETTLEKTIEKYPALSKNYVMSEEAEKVQGPWTNSTIVSTMSILKNNPVLGSEKVVEFLEDVIEEPGAYKKFCQIFNLNNKSCANVLCHGDLWNSNMLFKDNEETRKAEKCIFIDLQTVHLGSPVLDIQYYLHLVTSTSFRLKEWKALIKIYYENFKAHVESFGYKIDFSLETLLNEYRAKCLPGFNLCLYVIYGWDSLDEFGDLAQHDGNSVEHVSNVTKNQGKKFSGERGLEISKQIVREYEQYVQLISERD